MKHPVVYIVLNGELKMSPGKAAAQAVQATLSLERNLADTLQRTVIVLEAKNAEQIRSLEEYLNYAGIECDYYIDEGVNEVEPYSVTALVAVVPDEKDTESRLLFSGFALYNGYATVVLEDRFGFPKDRAVIPRSIWVKDRKTFKNLKKVAEQQT